MRINVIMSVYNESLDFINESIDSVLNQTYKDFFFIIVNDNPERVELDGCLKSWKEKDRRIILLKNTVNLGLALSMNKAATYLNSDYLIRMDADDICYPSRFEKIVKFIEGNNYDLVCSSFEYINENGEVIGVNKKIYSDDELRKYIHYDNVIHHPTTIFKTEIFNKVGKYNDFPCAQDYDLWCRFVKIGAKIHMLNDVLLRYRIQSNSTTSKKRFTQAVVMDYIKKINKADRLFDKKEFQFFLNQYKQKYENSYQLYYKNYENFLKSRKDLLSFIKSLILSSYIRKQFFKLINYHIFVKKYKLMKKIEILGVNYQNEK